MAVEIEEAKTVVLTREQAVNTQLDTAIWLWFGGEFDAPIYALADNALTILDVLAGKMDRESHMYSKAMHKLMGRKRVKHVARFLKHANTNPKAGIKFSPHVVEFLMFDAITLCARIYPPVSLLMATFGAWFATFHYTGGRISAEEAAKYLPQGATLVQISHLSRVDFLNTVLPLFAKFGYGETGGA